MTRLDLVLLFSTLTDGILAGLVLVYHSRRSARTGLPLRVFHLLLAILITFVFLLVKLATTVDPATGRRRGPPQRP